ncbi:MAG: dienelactone hydrolase family protein [Deltaproteobacteria bacterium]|jgi:carboxymethylenebutenolidase|nr:dienelactone hydrolase family protein [Deltaproteobacteria bacterium]
MCDEKTFADTDAQLERSGGMTRREFGALSVGAGLTMLWPELASAGNLVEQEIEIETPDGRADGYLVHPSEGRHPGVLIWPDAFGLRPAMRAIGKRLAASGYSVLVVNPYYRTTRAPILPEGEVDFEDPKTRETIMSLMATLTPQTQAIDAKAFVDYLDAQPAVAPDRKMGTMGYCMGGPITMRTAATRPDRIGAAASFHGGNLVTDADDSPHLLVPKMKAHYLFAIAENDDEAQPEAKDVLRESFAKNSLPAEIEVYEGALHGWCPPDMPVYHEAQAERAWGRLLVLFENALGAPA